MHSALVSFMFLAHALTSKVNQQCVADRSEHGGTDVDHHVPGRSMPVLLCLAIERSYIV